MSFHNVPELKLVDGAVAALLTPTALKFDPSYTFSCDADESNQSSPLIGDDGAVDDAEFSNNFTKFSLKGSPYD